MKYSGPANKCRSDRRRRQFRNAPRIVRECISMDEAGARGRLHRKVEKGNGEVKLTRVGPRLNGTVLMVRGPGLRGEWKITEEMLLILTLGLLLVFDVSCFVQLFGLILSKFSTCI